VGTVGAFAPVTALPILQAKSGKTEVNNYAHPRSYRELLFTLLVARKAYFHGVVSTVKREGSAALGRGQSSSYHLTVMVGHHYAGTFYRRAILQRENEHVEVALNTSIGAAC
jgi:hypothetical protein